jgi:hypothetical protein
VDNNVYLAHPSAEYYNPVGEKRWNILEKVYREKKNHI